MKRPDFEEAFISISLLVGILSLIAFVCYEVGYDKGMHKILRRNAFKEYRCEDLEDDLDKSKCFNNKFLDRIHGLEEQLFFKELDKGGEDGQVI